MLNINLKQLEVFVAVAECRSFTEAAESLYLAQSTVSSHIRGLEEALSVTLIQRSGKQKVTLTDSGRRIFPHAKEILRHCAALSQSGAEPDTLTVAASSIPGQYVLPRWMAAFSQKEPQCRFQLKKGDTESVHRMVLSGEAELGFVGGILDRKRLHYRQIAEDHLVLIAPNLPKFQKWKQQGASGNTLLMEPMIFRENGSGTQRAADEYLQRMGIGSDRLHVVASVDQTDMILRLVSEGMGVALVSDLSASQAVREGSVLEFPLDEENARRQIYMIFRKNVALSPWGQQFRVILEEG